MALDIAPFAYRDDSDKDRSLVFRWEEPRDIHQVAIGFPSGETVPDEVTAEYWRRYWPENRATEADLEHGAIGRAGWKPLDDWFNGEWQTADLRCRKEGDTLFVDFAPLSDTEFPELEDFNVTFRQALKLRLVLPESSPLPSTIRILTDTSLIQRDICVELGCGKEERPADAQVKVYNGVLEEVTAADEGGCLRMRVSCACPGLLSYDRTIVTVHSSDGAFSFLPDDLLEGDPIWSPDLGALVSLAEENLRYSSEVVAGLCRPGKSTYDRISEMPEQSLERALQGQPPKRPMHFIIGCEGGRQKFGIEPKGDLFARAGFVRRVAGADTPKVLWEGGEFRLKFHFDRWTANGKFVEGGFLPMVRSTFSDGDLDVTQEVFATVLGGIDQPVRGDAPVIAMVRLTFHSRGGLPLPLQQQFRFISGDPQTPEPLILRNDHLYCCGTSEFLRASLVSGPSGTFEICGDELLYKAELTEDGRHSLVLKVPFVALSSEEELDQLDALDFVSEHAAVRSYWQGRISSGSTIHTGEPDIDDFHRAHVTHTLINDDHEPGSDRIMGRVSSFNYANFSNEAIMQISELDRRGLHQEARRHLETYLHYQGTVGLPGNFQSKEGIFYGSGGYEHGDYNQHHGWVLWGLAEHYRLTGDSDWLRNIADKLIAGCDWVIRERMATKQTDAGGGPVVESGFLPAGTLEDVRDYYYWLSTNALTYRGLAAAAEVLHEIGHPEGVRLVEEAKAFREDLRAGFEESRVRAPLVKLRDGTYVPNYPSRLYWRGRDFGWIREVLEGSIILINTILDPNSTEATWILKDFEDNRYLDAPYNYPLENFEGQWFDRGGFSFQPNLLYFPPPYLFRDQVEHFLRAFFNGFAACWRPELRAMTEHPLPTLADWAGDHFKTSDESMVCYWLRQMFIQEVGNDLYLGRGLPRAWLGSGKKLFLRDAATHFGAMSFEIQASSDGKQISAAIDPPLRKPPDRMFVRFRHPEKRELKKITVNGQPCSSAEPEKEWVVLPPASERTTVEADYD